MRFDLHMHTHYSDGRHSPTEVLELCQKVGLEVIAITDHECVDGIPEAQEAGKELGIKVIPGIELAADCQGKEQHFLGFNIDYWSQELEKFLKKWEKTKIRQIKAMMGKLGKMGFAVGFQDVLAQARGSLGRSHLGYAVFAREDNKEILEEFGIKNMDDFFEKFMKKTAYVDRKRPQADEAIKLIKKIGGKAIWAHPCWNDQDLEYIAEKTVIFQGFGLDGIEVSYSPAFMTRGRARGLHKIARSLGFLETGGSDFHSLAMVKFNKVGDFKTFGLKLNLPSEVN